jgi:two-component system, OmpR family, sensor kinase
VVAAALRLSPAPAIGPRTLRGRLIAGLVTLLAIGCATVGVTTYMTTRDSLMRELRGQLQTATGLWWNCLNPPAGSSSAGSGLAANSGQQAGSGASRGAPIPSRSCTGLGPGTLEATVSSAGAVDPYVVDHPGAVLSPADAQALRQLTTTRALPAQDQGQPPIYYKTLGSLGGTYALTAIVNRDGDTACITGLSLRNVEDTLHDVAVTELLVFGSVVMLAGVLGTLWVGLSLRPLRRVALTACQVAELPLESGEVELPAGVPDIDPRTETGQVGAAFNRMLGHVQSALARRAASETRLRRFAADASHELRTPLAAIRGYAELALRRPGDSPEQVVHALNRVLSEATRMTVLVDDLLLLARLDAGRPLDRAPVDMSRLAIDATSDARVARPRHRWVLDLPDDPIMSLGDEHRLHQVLVNLLSNAGRHTPEGTTVTVKLSAEPAGSAGCAVVAPLSAHGPGGSGLGGTTGLGGAGLGGAVLVGTALGGAGLSGGGLSGTGLSGNGLSRPGPAGAGLASNGPGGAARNGTGLGGTALAGNGPGGTARSGTGLRGAGLRGTGLGGTGPGGTGPGGTAVSGTALHGTGLGAAPGGVVSPADAGQFAAPGDPPMVSRGLLPAGPRLVLAVTDDGPGIPPDLLPELFERFTRGDTARSRSGGESSTGLGLAIVEAVVAAHGGAVQVTSRPGQTRFAIILPHPAALATPAQRRAPARPQGPRLRPHTRPRH